ncbi:alpha/beta hydrolase [Phormidesmis priestleyi]|uniref:alpha/beta hydrolase n=1 Tax=Phormidesmis priestleyi TaxID=268141 RepID=UPI000839DED2|nr:alpha/beta hydrolase [Phormidesmis priestleyi]
MAQENQASHHQPRFRGNRKLGSIVAILLLSVVPPAFSLIGLFLSLWIVIPAPTLFLLPLGVGAPEISPWLVGVNAIAILLLLRFHQGLFSRIFLVGSVVALILSLLPLMQVSSTNQRFSVAMQSALGNDYLEQISQERRVNNRPSPFVLLDAFRGIPASDVRSTSNIQFSNPGGVPLTLNLYQPLQPGKYPTIVMIYGGAWQRGTPDSNESFSRYMAAHGYVVVAIDYRHAPQFKFPAQLEDINTAFAFVLDHVDDYNIDRDRIAVMGRSSGAHLAMLAAFQSDAPPIKAVVDYYGPVELTLGYRNPPNPDPIDSRATLKAFLGGTPDELPDLYRQASPYQYVTRPLPPTLLIYGGRDHIVQAKFGEALSERLQSVGSRAVFLEIPWADHAFDAVFNGVSNQLALYYTERFLEWALR